MFAFYSAVTHLVPNFLQQFQGPVGSRTKNVQCPSCNKLFWNRSDCEGHVNSKHLGLKPFKCRVCHKQFGYKNSWKFHEMGCSLNL